MLILGESGQTHFSGKAAPRITAIFWRTHFSGKAAPRITAIFWGTHFSGKAAPQITAIFRRTPPPPPNPEELRRPHQTPHFRRTPLSPKINTKVVNFCLTRGAFHIKFFNSLSEIQELGRKISTKLLGIFIS